MSIYNVIIKSYVNVNLKSAKCELKRLFKPKLHFPSNAMLKQCILAYFKVVVYRLYYSGHIQAA